MNGAWDTLRLMTQLPIRYAGFYDVPRRFLVSFDGASYFFESRFDDDLDEYEDLYTVFRLAASLDVRNEHAVNAIWSALPGSATRIGQVKLTDVRFDESQRRFIDDSVFARLVTE